MNSAAADRPTLFYRYRSLANGGVERLRQILHDSSMCFVNLASFNDPFDCRPSFSLEGTAQEVTSYFHGVYTRQAPYMDRKTRRTEVRKRLPD